MKLEFKKIGTDERSFALEVGTAQVVGFFKKIAPRLARIEAKLSGTIALVCDYTGVEYQETLDETVSLRISDGLYTPSSDEDYDIIECLDGVVDLNEIFLGELESIKADYHVMQK